MHYLIGWCILAIPSIDFVAGGALFDRVVYPGSDVARSASGGELPVASHSQFRHPYVLDDV